MDLRTSVDVLVQRLRVLADAVTDLRLTVIEDRPVGVEWLVLDALGDAVEDYTGWIHEALTEARRALGGQGETVVVHRLGTCQARLNRLSGGGWLGVITYEAYAELERLAHEENGQWPAWLAMTRLGLESCAQPLTDARAALLDCWQEAASARPTTTATGGAFHA